MSSEGFRDQVTADGSLLGVLGKWGACGWSVVQLDNDKEMGPMHEMYGTLDAELEIQRTIKGSELTAFLCFFRKAFGPTVVHVDNKWIIDELRTREMKYIDPKSKTSDLWTLIFRETLHRFHPERKLVEVEHVKAHRSKKEMQQMTLFERFITECNEKADELTKDGAMLDGREVVQTRANTVQQRREEVHAALQCAIRFHCLAEDWHDCEKLQPMPKESGLLWETKKTSGGVV